MIRNRWLSKKHLFFIGAVVVVILSLVMLKLVSQPSLNFKIIEPEPEPTPVEIVANEVENGLNHFFPILNGTIFENIPFGQANRTNSGSNSDGDAFFDWEVYDFGTADDDGYGGIVKIYDQGSVLKYVFENFQTPYEIWAGWITSPDTDQFPAGDYAWNFSVQTTQGTDQWQGSVTVAQQSDEQFTIKGTLQLLNAQGNFQLVISNTNPLLIDAIQSALLISGESMLTFTDSNGAIKQGTWTILDIGTSRLWIDENANGLIDNDEIRNINYDAKTGTWKIRSSEIYSEIR